MTLLRRALHDQDDEVRDRATVYLRLLERQQQQPDSNSAQILVQGKIIDLFVVLFLFNLLICCIIPI